MINDKIIQRAMAKLIIHDSHDLINLIRHYQPINSDISYVDLLLVTQKLLAENHDFGIKFTELLIRKKYLVDYNNADGKDAGSSALSFLSGPLTGLTNVFGSIINAGAAKKDRVVEQQQLTAQNTQNLMQYMMLEEKNKVSVAQQKSNLIYIAIGSMVVITGLIIFTSKK